MTAGANSTQSPFPSIVEHMEQLFHARSIDDVWQIHCRRMARYGFTRLLYAFTRFLDGTGFSDTDDLLLLSNHDADYLDIYVGQKMYLHGPMARWSQATTGTASWREVYSTFGLENAEQRRTMDFNRRHHVLAGYAISFPSATSRSKGAISLCARPGLSQSQVDAIWARYGAEIEVLNTAAHLQINAMPYIFAGQQLSHRQRQVLELVAKGHTVATIAGMLSLSIPTVEKHLRRARETLSVDTTAQAILKASFQNQIFSLPAQIRA